MAFYGNTNPTTPSTMLPLRLAATAVALAAATLAAIPAGPGLLAQEPAPPDTVSRPPAPPAAQPDTVAPDTAAAGARRPATAAAAPAQKPSRNRWKVVIDAAFTGAAGNDQLTVMSSGLRATHLLQEIFELEAHTQARYGRNRGQEVARNLRGGLKFDLYPRADWTPFVFTTAEHDPFRRLNLRANGGGGVRHMLMRERNRNLSVSLAGLYSIESYQAGATLPRNFDPRQHRARWSGRLRGQTQLLPTLRFDHTSLYLPVWNEMGDYLVESDSSVRARINERIGVTLSYGYQRDSTPRPEVRKNDHLVKAGVSIEL
jgi:hypothetical protein